MQTKKLQWVLLLLAAKIKLFAKFIHVNLLQAFKYKKPNCTKSKGPSRQRSPRNPSLKFPCKQDKDFFPSKNRNSYLSFQFLSMFTGAPI